MFNNFYSDYFELFSLFIIFILGVLSDNKILNSPKKRLSIQIIAILSFTLISDLEIISTRNIYLDNLLSVDFINIFFTSFCILILINGTNFIDGLNGNVLSYYLIITLLFLFSKFNFEYLFQSNSLNNLFIILILLLLFNYFNIIFLGDNGAYLLGFIFSILLIRLHKYNIDISPYFIIVILWYPCFENLFSIIRKQIFKTHAFQPDNKHLHQLIFFYNSKKFKKKSKLFINNLSSIILGCYHIPVMFFAFDNYNKTNIQLLLLLLNFIVYLIVYERLDKFKKKYSDQI